MHNVLLDPDGTLGLETGVLVIVGASTGVTYRHQCGGCATMEKALEGFLIPIAGPMTAKRIYDWFWREFSGNCYHGLSDRQPARVEQLRQLISELPAWYESESGSERSWLQLDESRLDQCLEAWIPVQTPYGPGILVLANSD